MMFLLLLFEVGTKLTGTYLLITPSCAAPSIEVTGPLEWMRPLGKQLQASGMVLLQIFVVAELVMYIILFKDLYCHNKELKNGNSLGLSADTLRKRQKKNVITLFGQCLSFVIEIVGTFIITFPIQGSINDGPIRIFLAALLVASYFVASPELKRFYFKK